MPRDFQIAGESLVYVKQGGSAISFQRLTELGLADEPIRVVPNYRHMPIVTDDYGPEIPAELLTMLADCHIYMSVIHFDPVVLQKCLMESMGGVVIMSGGVQDGMMLGAGIPLGGLYQAGLPNNHYIRLNIRCTANESIPIGQTSGSNFGTNGWFYTNQNGTNVTGSGPNPHNWMFPSAYLVEQPIEYPLSTHASKVKLHWRAIPYRGYAASTFLRSGAAGVAPGFTGEILVSGATVWSHQLDSV